MRKFLLKVSLLGIIAISLVILIFNYNDHLAESFYGPNTRSQIEMSFENALKSEATCWFLGNSRIYRLNPDVIENGNWYNFSHDNDSYNQMYYKLQYLLKNRCKVDTLVIGTDYFQFSVFSDTRNYVYDDLLGDDYIRDYNSWIIKEKINNLKRLIITKQNSVGRTMMGFVRNRGFRGNCTVVHILRQNGSYMDDEGKAKADDKANRDTTMLDIQKHYFERILELCRTKDISLYVLMMPLRDNELQCYQEEFITGFNEYINTTLSKYGYEGNYIDMSNNNDYKDYRLYTDITHLNSTAADSFTKCFYQELCDRNVEQQ